MDPGFGRPLGQSQVPVWTGICLHLIREHTDKSCNKCINSLREGLWSQGPPKKPWGNPDKIPLVVPLRNFLFPSFAAVYSFFLSGPNLYNHLEGKHAASEILSFLYIWFACSKKANKQAVAVTSREDRDRRLPCRSVGFGGCPTMPTLMPATMREPVRSGKARACGILNHFLTW